MTHSNRLLWGNWFLLLLEEGGKLRHTVTPVCALLIEVPVTLTLMVAFAYRTCSFFPVLCACPVLMLDFTARGGGNTPLTKVICRDGSFL